MMINIELLLDEYSKSVRIRQSGEFIFVTPPFFHLQSDESITLRFSQTEDGRPVISDCGTTKDYLDLMDIDIEDYREKLNAIKERFYIEEVDGAFVTTLPTGSINYVKKHLGYFIQALSIIANIDL